MWSQLDRFHISVFHGRLSSVHCVHENIHIVNIRRAHFLPFLFHAFSDSYFLRSVIAMALPATSTHFYDRRRYRSGNVLIVIAFDKWAAALRCTSIYSVTRAEWSIIRFLVHSEKPNLKMAKLSLIFVGIVSLVSLAAAIGPLGSFGVGVGSPKCELSLTTASGSYVVHKPTGQFCSGDLIFEETFDIFDLRKWNHLNTLSGNNVSECRTTTIIRVLILKLIVSNRIGSSNGTPTIDRIHFARRDSCICGQRWPLTYSARRSWAQGIWTFMADRQQMRMPALCSLFYSKSYLVLSFSCTDASSYGCERTGSVPLILNPIRSAHVRTIDSFAFKFGKVEISAKVPAGDWLSSVISFVPKDNAYGTWPASGEIELVQSKGNREMIQNGVNIGSEQVNSVLHFGPYAALDGGQSAQFSRNSKPGNGFNNDFHRYQMEWTPGACTMRVSFNIH